MVKYKLGVATGDRRHASESQIANVNVLWGKKLPLKVSYINWGLFD